MLHSHSSLLPLPLCISIYSHILPTKSTFLRSCFRAPGKDTRCSYGFYRPHLPYCGYFVLLYFGVRQKRSIQLVFSIVFTSTNLHVLPLDHSLIHMSSKYLVRDQLLLYKCVKCNDCGGHMTLQTRQKGGPAASKLLSLVTTKSSSSCWQAFTQSPSFHCSVWPG